MQGTRVTISDKNKSEEIQKQPDKNDQKKKNLRASNSAVIKVDHNLKEAFDDSEENTSSARRESQRRKG